MKDPIVLLIHLMATLAKFMGPGGAKSVVADSLLMKQQLLVVNCSRRRAPNLTALDRFLLGLWSLFINPRRLSKIAVAIKRSALLKFHEVLKMLKYKLLFSPRRNPRFGCPRIAQQINKAFGLDIDKDVVRRILAKHYHPQPNDGGPSWLTFIGHMKDSLWSVDLFRCESILLKTHWVLVVRDQFTRRIIGFGVHRGDVDGVALCKMFNKAISRMDTPKYLSTDHDPLFNFHRWKANLRVLDVEEIKTVPYVPLSHPFVERLIRTIRHEYLDNVFFWNVPDLVMKLEQFRSYYNNHRVHSSLDGNIPAEINNEAAFSKAEINGYEWQMHCRGLYQLPLAA